MTDAGEINYNKTADKSCLFTVHIMIASLPASFRAVERTSTKYVIQAYGLKLALLIDEG